MNDNILQTIQATLKAPKGQFNSFAKYHYRSCEDIVEAVKPILAKHQQALILSDKMIEIGGRVYVEATATISPLGVSATAYAREPENKKGMDESQVTGAASSYARKYALNGLFAIDDTKDADSHDNRNAEPPSKDQPTDSRLHRLANDLLSWADDGTPTNAYNAVQNLSGLDKRDVWAMLTTKQQQAVTAKAKGDK